jgi:hypothetical protein
VSGSPPAWGLDKGLTTPCCKKTSLLQNITQGLKLGWLLWSDLGNEKWIQDLEHGMLGVYRAGSLKTVASKLAK